MHTSNASTKRATLGIVRSTENEANACAAGQASEQAVGDSAAQAKAKAKAKRRKRAAHFSFKHPSRQAQVSGAGTAKSQTQIDGGAKS